MWRDTDSHAMYQELAYKLQQVFGPRTPEWIANFIVSATEAEIKNCSQEPQEPL